MISFKQYKVKPENYPYLKKHGMYLMVGYTVIFFFVSNTKPVFFSTCRVKSLPNKKKNIVLNKSPHVHKKSKERFTLFWPSKSQGSNHIIKKKYGYISPIIPIVNKNNRFDKNLAFLCNNCQGASYISESVRRSIQFYPSATFYYKKKVSVTFSLLVLIV